MIRPCAERDFATALEIINDGASAYRGVIPTDCWHEPYMSADALRAELAAGVRFAGWEEQGELLGVMGIQEVRDVTLIRHAYVRTAARRRGIGGQLLRHLLAGTSRPVLIGTWAAARWAIDYYERHGFEGVSPAEKDRLLATYWNIPAGQVETSVVLADARWRSRRMG